MGLLGQISGWVSDIHNIISIVALVIMAVMSAIGYKVQVLLFSMKIPERMAVIERDIKEIKDDIKENKEEHARRIGILEKTVYKI